MTASIVSSSTRTVGRSPSGRLIGFRPMVRKDLGEWAHGKRVWAILIATAMFMALSAANGAIGTWVIANAPEGATVPKSVSMVPLDNFMAAIGSQIFVVVAVFASMSLLVAERDHGTLSWVASKPVSRSAIWVSKWTAASVVIAFAAGIVPLAVVVAVVAVLYGTLSASVVVMTAVGMAASVVLIVAVVLAASTVVSNQAAVAAIGIAAFFLPGMLAGLLPVDVSAYLPASVLQWSVATGAGVDAGVVTPIAWGIAVVALVAFATWRMDKLEL
jgi:ABC-type transport system involved in multi-copper enzyme maturation permease subunit